MTRSHTTKSLSDPTRMAMFPNADQNEWQKRSIEVTAKISKMIQQGKTLIEIYDYARLERTEIAKRQNLTKTNPMDFGEVRGTVSHGREWHPADFYSPQEFAGGDPNPEALMKMKEILLEQGLTPTELTRERAEDLRDYGRDVEFGALPSDKLRLYQYTVPPNPNSARNFGHSDLTVDLYTHFDVENQKDTPDTWIKVTWGVMTRDIYEDSLRNINKLLNELKQESCQGDDALRKMGLLAHDLSRIMPLTRGTAAVNGWILRAIGNNKGFDIGVIKVRGLSFDICAEIQSNRDKYADDFVTSMKNQFELDKKLQQENSKSTKGENIPGKKQDKEAATAPPLTIAADVDNKKLNPNISSEKAFKETRNKTAINKAIALIETAVSGIKKGKYKNEIANFFELANQIANKDQSDLKKFLELQALLSALYALGKGQDKNLINVARYLENQFSGVNSILEMYPHPLKGAERTEQMSYKGAIMGDKEGFLNGNFVDLKKGTAKEAPIELLKNSVQYFGVTEQQALREVSAPINSAPNTYRVEQKGLLGFIGVFSKEVSKTKQPESFSGVIKQSEVSERVYSKIDAGRWRELGLDNKSNQKRPEKFCTALAEYLKIDKPTFTYEGEGAIAVAVIKSDKITVKIEFFGEQGYKVNAKGDATIIDKLNSISSENAPRMQV